MASSPHPSQAGYRSATAVTVSDANFFIETAALLINCTVAGNVAVTMVSGQTLVFAVATGMVILPLCITQLKSASTTATATYALLY